MTTAITKDEGKHLFDDTSDDFIQSHVDSFFTLDDQQEEVISGIILGSATMSTIIYVDDYING